MVLVLDEARVDKVSHSRARVPADVVSVDVDLLEMSDHVVLVDDVGLGARCSSSKGRGVILVATFGACYVHRREWESIRNLENAILIHTNDRTSSSGREAVGAVLDYLQDNLCAITG